MSRDFSVIEDARADLSWAFSLVGEAADKLRAGNFTETAHDLELAVGGLKHFAGPDGVLAHVEKGEGE